MGNHLDTPLSEGKVLSLDSSRFQDFGHSDSPSSTVLRPQVSMLYTTSSSFSEEVSSLGTIQIYVFCSWSETLWSYRFGSKTSYVVFSDFWRAETPPINLSRCSQWNSGRPLSVEGFRWHLDLVCHPSFGYPSGNLCKRWCHFPLGRNAKPEYIHFQSWYHRQ